MVFQARVCGRVAVAVIVCTPAVTSLNTGLVWGVPPSNE